MAAQFTLVPQDVISIINNEPRTTSLKVAEVFGKLHKNVLQKIESLDCSDEFTSANFSAHVQRVEIGQGAKRESKYYEMTKDGFMFLVMGFTGKAAARIKEAYIAAFNWMAAQLFGQPAATKSTADTRTPLRQAVSALVSKRGMMYPEAYALIHQRFAVEHLDQLTEEQIPLAVEYVHRMTIEGEWLGKADTSKAGLSEAEQMALHGLLVHVRSMREAWTMIEPALRAVKSPLAGRYHDHFADVSIPMRSLQGIAEQCAEVYRRRIGHLLLA